MPTPKRILLVDDNPQYRAAVTRNLTLAGYQVIEAEDSCEGMEKVSAEDPRIVITDLDMRSHDEGLHFIRELKRHAPTLPVIMISAVGAFEEGALARQYGAMLVLSKSRIDAEIEMLYQGLERIFNYLDRIRELRERLDETLPDESASASAREELQTLLQDQELDAGLKSEVYELLDRLDRPKPAPPADGADHQAVEAALREALPEFSKLDEETRTMLIVAEGLQQSANAASLPVARNISFSYSFAVENEVKLRIGRKVNRLLNAENIKGLADKLYDSSLQNLDIFFNQYLIRAVLQQSMELNSDITRQVVERILKHGDKYKPDGLKALGVILFLWGRTYEFTNRRGKNAVKNPLGIKGIGDEQIIQLASLLIRLQHLRNPFIHPEFSEREKTESLRQTAFACLTLVCQVV